MQETPYSILFKVQGGGDFGAGHVLRSLELASEFGPPWKVSFLCNDNKSIASQISGKGYQYNACPIDEEKEFAALSQTLKDQKIDILVVDQPTAYGTLCRKLHTAFQGLFIAGLDCFEDVTDINLTINLWNKNKKLKKSNNRLRGLAYAIIRASFCEYVARKKKVCNGIERVMLTFGSVDPNQNTLKTLDILNKISEKRLKIDVVLGFAFKDEEKIALACKASRHLCTVHREAKNFEELAFEADLAFSGAGTTMMELCAVGTPLIVFPQNKQEFLFAKIFEEKGAIRLLNFNEEEKALATIREMLGNNARSAMSEKQRLLIDCRGKKRIKSLIITQFKQFRSQ